MSTTKIKNHDNNATVIINGRDREKFQIIEVFDDGRVTLDGVERNSSPTNKPIIVIQGMCGDVDISDGDLIVAGDVMGSIVAFGDVFLDSDDAVVRGSVTSVHGDVHVNQVYGDVIASMGIVEAKVIHGNVEAEYYSETDNDGVCDICLSTSSTSQTQ